MGTAGVPEWVFWKSVDVPSWVHDQIRPPSALRTSWPSSCAAVSMKARSFGAYPTRANRNAFSTDYFLSGEQLLDTAMRTVMTNYPQKYEDHFSRQKTPHLYKFFTPGRFVCNFINLKNWTKVFLRSFEYQIQINGAELFPYSIQVENMTYLCISSTWEAMGNRD